MQNSRSKMARSGLLALVIGAAVISVGAQGRVGSVPDLVREVRTMLGHGDIAAARERVSAAPAGAPRELAAALVDLFAGQDAAARARLLPLAAAAPVGEAALELGLLEIRTGSPETGRRRLDALASIQTFSSPDDYLRLARAARAVREYLLANDAFQRVAAEARADIQTEWGDLFLLRHLPGEAVTNYRKALEVDPKWLPAMVNLARALADEEPDEATELLKAAQSQAPDYPDAWLAAAELQVESADLPAARQALDRLAAVKPNTLEEAALRVALAYKDQGIAAVEAAIARVREINPRSALGYRRAGEQAARDYRFADAAALAQKGVAIDPEDSAVHFDLGLAQLRTGEEGAARIALDTSWELDKSAPVTLNLLKLLDMLTTFETVVQERFIFKFDKKEAAVLKTYAMPLAEEAYKTFTARYGFAPKSPILIEVFPRHDDFAVRTLGLPGLVGALGACFGQVVTMDSPRARPPGEFSWQATLWHELAHVFTLQLSDYRVPRWLTEGISVFEEHRRQPAWGRELALQYAQALSKDKTFGVKKLPEAFKRPESLALAYFEASLVVEHLVALNGDAGLRTLLLAYAGGANDTEAFAKAFGRSIDDVDKLFAAFIAERYGSLRSAMADPPREVKSDDLAGLRARAAEAPGNFISQITLGQALMKSGDLTAAREPLEKAAALAPQASGEASPRALLALIAEEAKDEGRARRELRALLEFDHVNVAAARRLAALAASAKATSDENYALRLVADLDPFDADAHGLLGRRLLAQNENAAALVEFQAALALGPANRAEARADLAEAFLKLGRVDDARREALLALKEAPTYPRAQDLLLKAMGR